MEERLSRLSMTDSPPAVADRLLLTPNLSPLLPQPGGGGWQFSLLWTAEEELQTNLARRWKIDSQSLGKDTNRCSYVTDLPLE